ncbi:MAG: hypothetical protein AAF821_14465 [Cyanobacteria bacterium P01_D01_bin.156]
MTTASLIPPMPTLEPLQMLYVTNGSPLTAERWWLAHDYYQHRQNLHYQSLHRPGIVRGLGVQVISPPDTVSSELRDHRWVEVQPGIAIDLMGNPIVVEEPISFRITTEVIEHPITVYVVLAYVNPRHKQWSSIPADVVKEEFRINERTTPPAPQEVELCRLVLQDNQTALGNAVHVLTPTSHELNLCHRQWAQARAVYPVQVGFLGQAQESPHCDRIRALLSATTGLYPALASPPVVQEITLSSDVQLQHLTVLFIPYQQVDALSEKELRPLQQYVAEGGTVLVEYIDEPGSGPSLSELQRVQTELLTALNDLDNVEAGSDLDRMRQDLVTELGDCRAVTQAQLQAITQTLHGLMSPLGDAAPSVVPLPVDQPFCFDELPVLPTGPLQLQAWDGVVLVIGDLSAAWTSQQFDQPLARDTLRSAQELGINILYQASQRQQLKQAQMGSDLEVIPA